MQASNNSINAISTAVQLLPTLKSLQNHEKLFVIQFLVAELSRTDKGFVLPDEVYPVWSPFDSYEAADVMLQALKNRQVQISD